MEYTDVTLDCYGVTTAPDTEEFKIEATVDDAGELPTVGIFVYAIGDSTDASTDTFARIANAQDLQNLLLNRADTVTAGDAEYLSSFASFQYTDLDVAISAKAMLKTRINELVKKWLLYQETFLLNTGVSQAYPSSDPEVEDALIDAYTDARDARIVATEALEDATTALESAIEDVDASQGYIDVYQACREFVVEFNEKFYEYTDAVVTEGPTATPLRLTLESLLVTRGAACSAGLQTWQNTKTANESAVTTATQDKIEAEQTLTAAQAAEDAALVAVLAVCPDFDTSSV